MTFFEHTYFVSYSCDGLDIQRAYGFSEIDLNRKIKNHETLKIIKNVIENEFGVNGLIIINFIKLKTRIKIQK